MTTPTFTHKVYDNFVLSTLVEDQFNSHLNLQNLITVDNSLSGVPGMIWKVHKYKATDGTEFLEVGKGNTKSIAVSYEEDEHKIKLAQNRFDYYDEQAMTDPMLVPVGMQHAGTDMFNTVNKEIYGELLKATLEVTATKPDFGAFVDAVAKLNFENPENKEIYALVSVDDVASIRKELKEDLKYVESFSRTGYIGTVAGVNIYTKKDAEKGTIVVATRKAVTLFNKVGTQVEQSLRSQEEANIRLNSIFTRKYFVVALTDEREVVKLKINAL